MHSRVRIPYASPFDQIGRISLAFFFAVRIGAHLGQWTCLGYRMDMRIENSENLQKNYCQSRKVMLIYNSTREKPEFYIQWRVGETVNSHAFHACIHGFESRTSHHFWRFSSVGRASALQAEGQRFEPVSLHH